MEYNQYIIQKHRLALALAIIKSKPENVSLEEYIAVIRRKIEINDEIDNDIEMSVKSEDFDIERVDDFNDETEFNTDDEQDLGVNANILTNTLPVTKDLGEQLVLPSHLDTDITNIKSVNIKPASIPTTSHVSSSMASREIIIYKIPENQVAQSQSEFVKIPKNYLFNINKKENSKLRENVKETEDNIKYDANRNYNEENAIISKTSTDIETELFRVSDHFDDGENVTEDLFEFDEDKDYFNDTHDASSVDDFLDNNSQRDIDTGFGQNSQFTIVDINKYVAENSIVDDTRTEAINFKVVTELNHLKTYLRQGAGNDSLDSGCKTYSPTNGSTWINQSALTLINYIKSCPLLEANEKFRLETSQILGELIDRLYEEKRCPQFFDILLEDVNILIQKIYNEKEEELLEKDDCVARILLLNQSQHIVKYSIKKIYDLLQVFSSEAEKSEILLEIDNIDKIENLAYIFVVLEKLLRISKKNERLTKHVSQSTSSFSQDKDKRLSNSEGSLEIFDLRSCGKLLNNIISSNIEGYGLISFAALRCFNVIQS